MWKMDINQGSDHYGLILDKGVLYNSSGLKAWTHCHYYSVPIITQLEVYYGEISWNITGINSVLIQESITLTLLGIWERIAVFEVVYSH